jgi:hypothetical protein
MVLGRNPRGLRQVAKTIAPRGIEPRHTSVVSGVRAREQGLSTNNRLSYRLLNSSTLVRKIRPSSLLAIIYLEYFLRQQKNWN